MIIYSCFGCGQDVPEDDAVWIDPSDGRATTTGVSFHVECAPPQEVIAPLYETCLSDGDYTLTAGCAWFKVDTFAGPGFAIRIAKTDDGVAVDIYRDGREDEDALASCYAFDGELEDAPEEEN